MKNAFEKIVSAVNQEIDRTSREARKAAHTSREAIEGQIQRARGYFESDEFERHLDEFAAKVGIDWAKHSAEAVRSADRKPRVAAKSRAVVHLCRDQVGAAAASSMSITASLIRDPQIIAGVTLACTGGLTLYYVWVAANIVTRENPNFEPARA